MLPHPSPADFLVLQRRAKLSHPPEVEVAEHCQNHHSKSKLQHVFHFFLLFFSLIILKIQDHREWRKRSGATARPLLGQGPRLAQVHFLSVPPSSKLSILINLNFLSGWQVGRSHLDHLYRLYCFIRAPFHILLVGRRLAIVRGKILSIKNVNITHFVVVRFFFSFFRINSVINVSGGSEAKATSMVKLYIAAIYNCSVNGNLGIRRG